MSNIFLPGDLKQLTYLRLAFNSFKDSLPSSLSQLTNLELLQFQSNRIFGSVPHIDSNHILKAAKGSSALVSDCGSPSIFQDPNKLFCLDCTVSLQACDPPAVILHHSPPTSRFVDLLQRRKKMCNERRNSCTGGRFC